MGELRQKNKTLGEEVDKIIKKETFEEKVQLERAMERYNNKMNKVLKSKEVADRLDKQEDCQEKMLDLVSKVRSSYRKAIREIMRQPISKEEKNTKINVLREAIEDAILSADERKIMKAIQQQMSSLPFQNVRLLC